MKSTHLVNPGTALPSSTCRINIVFLPNQFGKYIPIHSKIVQHMRVPK